jgi:hypothetical protein
MPKADDLPTTEQIREDFAPEPGKGHLAEAALAERANLAAYGGDTSAVDKRLAALGLGGTASKEQIKAAAAERAAALDESTGSGPGRSGADPAPSYPSAEEPDAEPEGPDPGSVGQAADAGDAAASGDGGQGEPAESGAGAGTEGDGEPEGNGGASPARKRVTPGRKPGGPKSTT